MESTTNGTERLFPPDFAWGAAVSAYQIEGAVEADGRGESIWDRFTTIPGTIENGETGEVACDSYHRYREDVALMRDLGLNAFRFSIAWPRVLPEGRGWPNGAGLDFYDRLVDELLEAGIEPYVTLYHWDLPQTLEDAGGWPVRSVVDAFAEYVEIVASRLGDRVKRWITQNEPWVIGWLGYGYGTHAPGRKSEREALAAMHHVLVAHGRALEILRRDVRDALVGITIDVVPMYPASTSEADVSATRLQDGFRNRWLLDPVLRGEYPADLVEHFADVLPDVRDGDLEAISAPIDLLGINYYTRNIVRADPVSGEPAVVEAEGAEHTTKGWEVFPDGLTEMLVRLNADYDLPPLYITENGAAYPDARENGSVDDPRRASYLEQHVGAIGAAIEQGVPVAGYFVWSLLDNFEWAQGYSQRFGIVYVDFETLERIPKRSYGWYRDFIRSQRAPAPAST